MSRVNEETAKKVANFLDNQPPEFWNKCTLCNTTLLDTVKKGEVQTGAGTYTIVKAISERFNENAPSQDKVTGNALNQRVRQQEGLKLSDRQNKKTKKGVAQNAPLNKSEPNPPPSSAYAKEQMKKKDKAATTPNDKQTNEMPGTTPSSGSESNAAAHARESGDKNRNCSNGTNKNSEPEPSTDSARSKGQKNNAKAAATTGEQEDNDKADTTPSSGSESSPWILATEAVEALKRIHLQNKDAVECLESVRNFIDQQIERCKGSASPDQGD